jgi:hypothetical protein
MTQLGDSVRDIFNFTYFTGAKMYLKLLCEFKNTFNRSCKEI